MSENELSKEYVPMIKEVSIGNFKGIKHCEIKDIGKVNLFIGRNGCGKSSIMEAIYFIGKEFLGEALPQCIQRRANRGAWSARELWHDYQLEDDVNIRLAFNEQDYTQMSIRFRPQDNRVHVQLYSDSPTTGKKENVRQYYFGNFQPAIHRGPAEVSSPQSEQIRHYFLQSVLIDPTIKTNVTQIERSYLNMIKLSETSSSDLAKRISEIYETEPNFEFLPHPDFSADTPSRFAILEGKRRLFLDNFGDGLHYGLAIMAIAKTRKNTALFIEEIESHQHAEAIRSLISNLLNIARTNNLQLFMTTHNQSVWRYLYYHYKNPEERNKEFRCFHVMRDNDSGKVEARIEEGIVNIQPDLHGTP